MSQFPPAGNPGFAPNPYASPGAPGQPMPPGTVKNYLVESILSLICCGGLFAIPAIVYAAQVNGKLAAGDYNGAVESSNNAKKWLIIAVCIGLVCNSIAIGVQILGAIAQNQ
ncbi:MAG: CD225/dispanin family protein [Pirellulaceae bacterium]|nr:CD225/dispanin family protein [Pirellulaceae bacterium]